MKSRFFILLSITLYSLQVNAQFSLKAQSDLFDEPQAGSAKLILLSDGSTALFILENGMSLRLYDASHRPKLNNDNILPSTGKKKRLAFHTAFENGGTLKTSDFFPCLIMMQKGISMQPLSWKKKDVPNRCG